MTTRTDIVRALGAKVHSPRIDSVIVDEQATNRVAVCAVCELGISSWYDDDPDQITGWTPWKAQGSYCKA